MADLPLPHGAELVDGSIRMQAVPEPGQTVQRLAGRVFNEDEARAVNRFLEGELGLGELSTQHLVRFGDGAINWLVIKIWMRTRFGEDFKKSINQHLADIENEEQDPTAVFIKLFHELETVRKGSLHLDVRRPERAMRNLISVKQVGGGRSYTADTGSEKQPTQHAAVQDRTDPILIREIERFGRMPGMPEGPTASTIIEQFTLGNQSIEDTLKRLRGLPMTDRSGKRVSSELKELILVSNTVTAWMVVAFDLDWTSVLLYVRKKLTRQQGTPADVFYELYGKFSAVADVREEHELHHSTANQLIQFAFQQLDPPADADSVREDSSRIDWRRFDEEPVPESRREKIAAQICEALKNQDVGG